MHHFGAHTSVAKGLCNAAANAHAIGADAFALFTKSQRQWTVPSLKEEDIQLFTSAVSRFGFDTSQILPHAGYLINLGNPEPEKRRKSVDSFIMELERVRLLGLRKLNVHPGSHLGRISVQEELRLIADSLDRAMEQVPEVHPVLETTAGQGGCVGRCFEEIRDIIALSSYPQRLGVCIDTCHCFAAGYDIRTPQGYEQTMEKFGEVIGFGKLEGMHLNDSQGKLASHVDRHAALGKGEIGLVPFALIAKDPRVSGIPLILETPVEEKNPAPRQWKEEIAWLRSQCTDETATDTPRNGR